MPPMPLAKCLSFEKEQELAGIYEGHPKRSTTTPSAQRLFRAFIGLSIAVIFQQKTCSFAVMTQLDPVQVRILNLLGISKTLYIDLAPKIQIFFTKIEVSET